MPKGLRGFQKGNKVGYLGHRFEKGNKCGLDSKGHPPNYKGGLRQDGYIYIYKPKHPFTQKGGYIAEHRLVMEKCLNRYLEPREIIHHKNGVRDDNRIENLEIVIAAEHRNKRIKIKCPFCEETFLIRH